MNHFYGNVGNLDETLESRYDNALLPGRGQTKAGPVSPL